MRDKIMRECVTEHSLAPCPPFSIINPSQVKVKTKSDQIYGLGRKYEWGWVDSNDPNNSDFSRLHKLLLRYLRSELISTVEEKQKVFNAL